MQEKRRKRCQHCDVLLLPDKPHPPDCRSDSRFWTDALVYWTAGYRPMLIRKSKTADRFIAVAVRDVTAMFDLIPPEDADYIPLVNEAIEKAHSQSMYSSPVPRAMNQPGVSRETMRTYTGDGRYLLRNVWNDEAYLSLHIISYDLCRLRDYFASFDWSHSMLVDVKPEMRAKFGDHTLNVGDEPARMGGFAQDPYAGTPVSYSYVAGYDTRPPIRGR